MITQSSTHRYTSHIHLLCPGGASGKSTTGEWALKPVTQLSVSLREVRVRKDHSYSGGGLCWEPCTRQWHKLLCAQQGLLLDHQWSPAVGDDRHSLRNDPKPPRPCQQVSPGAAFISCCTWRYFCKWKGKRFKIILNTFFSLTLLQIWLCSKWWADLLWKTQSAPVSHSDGR